MDRADIVVLRRVVCCSPNGPALLGLGPARTSRHCSRAIREIGCRPGRPRLQNIVLRADTQAVPVYVHSPEDYSKPLPAAASARSRVSQGIVWETAQYDVTARDEFLTIR